MKAKSSKLKKYNTEDIVYLLPVFAITFIAPFLIYSKEIQTNLDQYDCFPMEMGTVYDFFLYYRSRFLVAIAVVMLILLVDRCLIKNIAFVFDKSMYGVAIFEAFAVISAIFSKNRSYCLDGMVEHFETIWVLLAYGIFYVYARQIMDSERNVQLVMQSEAVCAFLQALIGFSQIINHDILNLDFVKKLYTSETLNTAQLLIQDNYDASRKVYGTLYNGANAGIFFAISLFVIIGLYIMCGERRQKIFCIIDGVLCLVSLFFTGCKSAMLALGVGCIILFIHCLMEGHTFKKKLGKIVVLSMTGLAVIGCAVGLAISQDSVFSKKIGKLESIDLSGGDVGVVYNGQRIQCGHFDSGAGYHFPYITDSHGKFLELEMDQSTGYEHVTDESKQLDGLLVRSYDKDGISYLVIRVQDVDLKFTDTVTDYGYLYINPYGKADDIVNAKSVLFNGLESLFSKRGYIWGRTLPLLGSHILTGCGTDTFVLEFPQDDYCQKANLGNDFMTQIITKPHNAYLQIWMQDGLFALIGVLWVVIISLGKSQLISIQAMCGKELQNGRIAKDHPITVILGAMILTSLIAAIWNDSSIIITPLICIFLAGCYPCKS